MPMHDWTRVPDGIWHDMHFAWAAALAGKLNQGVLPVGRLYALTEYNESPLDSTLKFDIPDSDFDLSDEERLYVRKRRTVTLRRSTDDAKAGLIEITSPGLKRNPIALHSFIEKVVAGLHRGFGVLLVDPFPPTARDPKGIHAAIWRKLVGKRFTPPADKPLTLVSYAAEPDDYFAAYVEPLAVGDPIREMPLFLTPGEYVNVPLEETYQQAWAGFPKPWQKVVEGR